MSDRYRPEIGAGSRGSDDRREFEILDGEDEPTSESLRLLRRLDASAVTVLTTRDAAGYHGITVSAFCIISLAPGRLLACLTTGGDALAAVAATGQFAVSVLSDGQEFLADRFAGRAPLVNPRFAGVKHRLTRLGNPVLEDSLAWFDCGVDSVVDQGDHAVVFGSVREAGYGTGLAPLLYFDGKYRVLQLD